ncbi:MAG: 4-alpha-glucanotransferase [Acidimicrobiia bacterium]|nr:4-alpha-glucanotransferase [Acidimicrobiia bacterium]
MEELPDDLAARATAAGVQLGYHAMDGSWTPGRADTIAAVLDALGGSAEPSPRVHVAWDGSLRDAPGAGEILLEDGSVRRLPLDGPLPLGYHHLRAGANPELVIAAPERLDGLESLGRGWGLFVPLYALHTARTRSVADLADLGALGAWAASHGAKALVTLPLLASYTPDEISPYAPVSRLFFNELYADLDRLPGARSGPSTPPALPLAPPAAPLSGVGGVDEIDFAAAHAQRSAVLRSAADAFFAAGATDPAFARYEASHPLVRPYAAFRAAIGRHGRDHRAWTSTVRAEVAAAAEGDADARYHRYAQWVIRGQLGGLDRELRARGVALGLDLPLGCHPDGFDQWWQPDAFARGASAGAPPDNFFTLGQDWGFRPLSPAGLRATDYRYLREALAAHLRVCGLLRIDHVMSLYRLWWIPDGHSADDGAYVRYPEDELFAVLCLEAHRAGTVVVGENLGTVPAELDERLRRHHLPGMQLVQEELGGVLHGPLRIVGPDTVAFLTNHDTAPFAAWWNGGDIEDRRDLGLIDDAETARQHDERARVSAALVDELVRTGHLDRGDAAGPDALAVTEVLAGLLEAMASSPPDLVVASLEDLWGEQRRQNTPGTSWQRPNWRRRAARSFEQFADDPAVARLLARLDRARRAATG